MKKYIKIVLSLGIFAVMLMSASASAQKTMQPERDSIVNAQTKYLTPQVKGFEIASFVLQTEKVSGTVAGTAVLQGSFDGTIWYTVTDINSQGSVNLSDGANNIRWLLDMQHYPRYRVAVTGTGTSKSYIKGLYYAPGGG
jgi:hypothetical protein